MGKFRWGVIGAGGIADKRVLPALKRSCCCSLTALMDVRNADALGRKHGVSATDDMQALLAREDVDAVYVATPVHLHAEHAIAAVRAGKHVLCEKPLARTVAEAETMIAASREAGVLLQEAYMLRFHGAHQAITRLVSSGAIGTPLYVRVQWSFYYPETEGAWRQNASLGGGGALADVGVHAFDLLQMILGPIARVAAFVGNLVHTYPVEDTATALLAFRSGAQGTVAVSFASQSGTPSLLEVFGSSGLIRSVATMGQEPGGIATIQQQGEGEARAIPYSPANTYQRELEDFARRVWRGERLASTAEEEMLGSPRVLAGAYRSAKTGRFSEV